DFLWRAQQSDGGFGGREGGSDLYYTGFALRSLAVLGELDGTRAERAADFLRGRLGGQETIIDFLSLVYGAALLDSSAGVDVFAGAAPQWQDKVAASLEQLRRDDGGYAKGPEGTASSTYHTFLVALCRELIDRPLPQPQRAVAFVLSQRADGGGFREIRASKRAGANPTAAAIGLLKMLDGLTEEVREETLDFLVEMQTDEGGLRANTRIPFADLLSSFTALLTLQDLQGDDEINGAALLRYVRSLELPTGGFRAASLDEATDVEYTFYGLGTLGLLAPT
ncbi:MAG: geranyl transferase, partial [Planctomycetales bacterium]|nr:geranyl transferase [Planctomycetales bacterium]